MGCMVTPRVSTDIPVFKQIIRTAECVAPFIGRLVEQVRDMTLQCKAGGFTEFMLRSDPESDPSGFVRARTEQLLILESRVSPNNEKDPFGLRRVTMDREIDHRYSPDPP